MLRTLASVTAVSLAAIFSGEDAQAGRLKGQDGCRDRPDAACLKFDHDDPIPVVRSFQIAGGRPGSYEIHFNGSMECSNASSSRAIIDLVSQITTDAEGTPAIDAPSGLRHAVVLDPGVAGQPAPSESFTLFSVRTLTTTVPNQVVSFRLARARMDPGTSCRLFNDSLSAFFVGEQENKIVTGGVPCDGSSGMCNGFGRSHVMTPAGMVFNAPSPGRALVSVHATLYCGGAASAPEPLEIASQLVPGDRLPQSNGPGGLRSRLVLQPGMPQHSDTLSLASTRIFKIVPGENELNLSVLQTRMGPSTMCYLFNNAVSVIFAPTGSRLKLSAQQPCTAGGGFCRRIDGNKRVVARSYKINAPSAGVARLRFNGSLVCTNDRATAFDVVAKGAIVEHRKRIRAPNPNSAGGMRQAQRLRAGSVVTSADTFNLSASRLVKFSRAGRRSFDFVLDVRSGKGSQKCKLYNASFSSVFNPT